jgi:hypothetical protein
MVAVMRDWLVIAIVLVLLGAGFSLFGSTNNAWVSPDMAYIFAVVAAGSTPSAT